MIHFKKHIGIHGATGKKLRLPQDMVIVDGRFVGYLTHAGEDQTPNLMLLAELSESSLAKLIREAETKAGRKVNVVGRPPEIPAEWLVEDDEEDEDEDETEEPNE